MSGCTLRFSRDSVLRTTLVDEATGNAKYQIDTPVKIARSVTRIRKFDSPTQPPLHWDEDADSDSGNDITDKGKSKSEKGGNHGEERLETEPELAETSDEIARIYWKWFSSDKIVFRGRISSRSDFLSKCGKMKGWVSSRCALRRELSLFFFKSGAICSPDQTVFSIDGQWAQRG
jgi:hypothetical protein